MIEEGVKYENMKHLSRFENLTVVIGTALGLSQIETLLGISLLIVQLGIVLYKGIYAIIKHIKNKEFNEVIDDLENIKDELEDIKEDIGDNNGKV